MTPDAHRLIESPHNPRFRDLRRLQDSAGIRRQGRALVSGARIVGDLVEQLPHLCRALVVEQGRDELAAPLPARIPRWRVARDLFRELDEFGTGHPLLVVEAPELPAWSPEDGFPKGLTVLLPLQDPENLGACLRSAAAFGAAQAVLLTEAAHPFLPRAVRASAGASFLIPLRRGPALRELPVIPAVVALSGEGRPLEEATYAEAAGLLVGMEGPGLPDRWRAQSHAVPLRGRVESLNAAAALSIALYDWARRPG